jgi:hypothetical protein
LQGINLTIPRVENEVLCLYTLHEAVGKIGGFTKCCKEQKWGELATDLGYTNKAGAGSTLRTYYLKILYPFDVVSMIREILQQNNSLGNFLTFYLQTKNHHYKYGCKFDNYQLRN